MVNLKITAECTDPKCGHTVQLIPDAEGSSHYVGICGGCGFEYAGDVGSIPGPPGTEAASPPAKAATTTTKAATT